MVRVIRIHRLEELGRDRLPLEAFGALFDRPQHRKPIEQLGLIVGILRVGHRHRVLIGLIPRRLLPRSGPLIQGGDRREVPLLARGRVRHV
jgi:hypothetical protein